MPITDYLFNDFRKAKSEADLAKQEAMKAMFLNKSIGSYSNVPTAEEEVALKQLFENKQATNVAPNIFPQPTQQLENQAPPQAPIAQEFASPRAAFQKEKGVSPDVPTNIYLALEKANKENDYTPVIATKEDELLSGGQIKAGTATTVGRLKLFAKAENAKTMAEGMAGRQQNTFEQQENQQARGFGQQNKINALNEKQKRETERLKVDPSAKSKYVELNQNIDLATKLMNDLDRADKIGLNVTGLLNYPKARFKEITNTLPKDQQDLLGEVRENFARFGRQMGGTAFTQTEKEVFAPIMPGVLLPTETNLNRISRVVEELNNVKKNHETIYPGIKEVILNPSSKKPVGIVKEIYAVNPSNNARIKSIDGGKTWQLAPPK